MPFLWPVDMITPDRARHDQFAELFVRNQSRLYGYILTMVPNLADADELFQQTSLTLWQIWDRYEPGRPFLPWAYGIARNHVRNFLRGRQHRPAMLSEAVLDELAERRLADDALLEQQQNALKLCLEKLLPRQRKLVEQCYAQRGSLRAVAETQGRSVDGLYKAIQRIRAILYDCISRTLAAGGKA